MGERRLFSSSLQPAHGHTEAAAAHDHREGVPNSVPQSLMSTLTSCMSTDSGVSQAHMAHTYVFWA